MAAKLPETQHPVKAFGWAATDTSAFLSPFNFSRRDDLESVIQTFTTSRTSGGGSIYPMVPGHEIVGIVTEVGDKVKKVKVGDKVGVGCLVGSCHSCNDCLVDLENYCPKMILKIAAPK